MDGACTSLRLSGVREQSGCTDACIAFPVQIVVPGTTALLQDLLPDTDYNVGVVAMYSDGEGPAISDAGKTRKDPKHSLAAHHAVFCAALVFSYIHRYAKMFTLYIFVPGPQCHVVRRGTCRCMTPPPAH